MPEQLAPDRELAALDERRIQAMLARDMVTLRSPLHDELVYGHSNGGEDSKADYLSRLERGVVRYASGKLDIQHVVVLGDVALITAVLTAEAFSNEKPVRLRNKYLGVWVRSGPTWKMIAHHPTALPGE